MDTRSFLFAMSLLIACGDEPKSIDINTEEPQEESIDSDGDGYFSDEDCDDQDAQTNPNAEELCDGVDNDCDGEIDEDLETNTYNYLTYGNQVWTVENAKMVTYRDGTEIPQVTDNTWANLTTGAWCYYDNDPTKGKLYNWYAVMGIHDTDPNTPNKVFAPQGWHVPTDTEWTTLENYLIANGYNYDGTTSGDRIAKAMASTTGWYSSTNTGAVGNDQSLNNSSGFNAFPVGDRNDDGSFHAEGGNAVFWSSTEKIMNVVWHRNLNSARSSMPTYFSNKSSGFSVRFVRD